MTNETTAKEDVAEEPQFIVPVTDQLEMYALMGQLAVYPAYDADKALKVFDALWPKRRQRAVSSKVGWLRVTVSRNRDGGKTYRAFHPNGRCLCVAAVSDLGWGIAVIERMEMRWHANPADVGAAVLKVVRADLARVRAKLWPTPPTEMSDTEFLAWWAFEKDDITYYPHRERLGLTLTPEEEEGLNDNRHMLSYLRDKSKATGKSMRRLVDEALDEPDDVEEEDAAR